MLRREFFGAAALPIIGMTSKEKIDPILDATSNVIIANTEYRILTDKLQNRSVDILLKHQRIPRWHYFVVYFLFDESTLGEYQRLHNDKNSFISHHIVKDEHLTSNMDEFQNVMMNKIEQLLSKYGMVARGISFREESLA